MPTLVIEDGTIITNANSYATLIQIRSYSSDRGITLSDDDDVVSEYAILAMDYLNTFSDKYQGIKTDLLQLLDWPRTGVYIDGVEMTSDYMPPELVKAQSAVVVEISKGNNLLPIRIGAQIRREQIGPMSTEYFSPPSFTATIPILSYILAPLLRNTAPLSVRRV